MGENTLGRRLNPWLHQAGGEVAGADVGELVQVAPSALLGISAAAARIRQELGVAGRRADDTTAETAQGLTRENFDLGPALRTAADLWHSQVTTLHQACHKIEQSLAANANGHVMTEDANEMSMKDIAGRFQ